MRFDLAFTLVSLTCASNIAAHLLDDEAAGLLQMHVVKSAEKMDEQKMKSDCLIPTGCEGVIGQHNKDRKHYVGTDVIVNHGGCFELDKKREGFLVNRTEATSAETCQQACLHTSGCSYFAFWSGGGCHLHSSCSTEVAANNPNVTSGPISCHPDWHEPACNWTQDTTTTTTTTTILTTTTTTAVGGGASSATCTGLTLLGQGPQAGKFSNPQTSAITNKAYQKVGCVEWKIFQKMNEKRKAGFSCGPPFNTQCSGSGDPASNCGNWDLQFDCNLWWASKQHAEDMVKRNYYSHSTLSTDTATARQNLDLVVPNGGFTAASQILEWVDKFRRLNHTSEFTNETMQERAARLGNVVADVEILIFERASNEDLQTPDLTAPSDPDSIADRAVADWLASPAHCNGIAQNENRFAGFAMAPCNDMPCLAGYAPTWQLMGLFNKDPNFQPDTSCYPAN